MWARVATLCEARRREDGTTEGAISERAFGNRTFISRARVSGAIPSAERFQALAEELGVNALWLLTGVGEPTSGDTSALLSQTLPEFIAQVSGSGMATWAVQHPREAPTLGEVAAALRVLRAEVAADGTRYYSRSDGTRVREWDAFFEVLRHGMPAKTTLEIAQEKQQASPLARPPGEDPPALPNAAESRPDTKKSSKRT